MSSDIIPVLLGTDLNSYGMARAFHEKYGVRSYVFGRYELGAVKYSRITEYRRFDLGEGEEKAVSELTGFASEHPGAALYLFGCTDEYAEFIISNRDVLSRSYFCPCPSSETASELKYKMSFYKLCEARGIPYPKTFFLGSKDDYSSLTADILGFQYPVIIKPSYSALYWKHPFPSMKKVYLASDEHEARDIVSRVFSSGYDDYIIIQDRVPGDDGSMYVMTAYSDTDGKVRMTCTGHVLLEEHTPKGRGNHTSIITVRNDALEKLVTDFLEGLGYTGFSNFDIKYDPRDGTYRFLEINLRQGRSNYYVTGSGLNLASYPVTDREGKPFPDVPDKPAEHFWRTVPMKIVYEYIRGTAPEAEVRRLISEKKSCSTLIYPFDIRMNPLRTAYISVHMLRYFGKYGKAEKSSL